LNGVPINALVQSILLKIEEISNLTTQEYIEMICTFEYYTNSNKYSCKSRSFKSDKEKVDFESRNGCKVDNKFTKFEYDNLRFTKCCCNHLSGDFNFIMGMFEQYDKGNLPFSGCYTDQPNKVIDLMNLIQKLNHDREDRLNKENMKKNSLKK
jgi:hypothetical protein